MARKNNYLSNKRLVPMVAECQQKGFVTDEMARAIMLLAHRYSRKPNFMGYSYREELEFEAVAQMVSAVPKINLEKSANVFAYLTTVSHNAMLRILNKEKRQREIRDAILKEAGKKGSFTSEVEGDRAGT
jgi:DNA-directed RNA polymerase specialized sigma24 family protein